jgi:hypothetical protein
MRRRGNADFDSGFGRSVRVPRIRGSRIPVRLERTYPQPTYRQVPTYSQVTGRRRSRPYRGDERRTLPSTPTHLARHIPQHPRKRSRIPVLLRTWRRLPRDRAPIYCRIHRAKGTKPSLIPIPSWRRWRRGSVRCRCPQCTRRSRIPVFLDRWRPTSGQRGHNNFRRNRARGIQPYTTLPSTSRGTQTIPVLASPRRTRNSSRVPVLANTRRIT